jgi:hypothetical protein
VEGRSLRSSGGLQEEEEEESGEEEPEEGKDYSWKKTIMIGPSYQVPTSHCLPVFRIRDPVLFLPLDPGWKKIRILIRDEHPRSFFRELRNSS